MVAFLTSIAVLIGAALLAGEVLDTTLQSVVYDRAITISPAEVRNQITIVAIDDPTISQYGRYPLPRQAYTDLLRALKAMQPSVIAFDVGFYDPSANPDEDRAFAAAIKDAGNVVLAMQGAGDGALGDHTTTYACVTRSCGSRARTVRPTGRSRCSPLRRSSAPI